MDQYKSELEKAKSEVETLTKTKDRLKADKDEMAGRRCRHPSRITLPKRDPSHLTTTTNWPGSHLGPAMRR